LHHWATSVSLLPMDRRAPGALEIPFVGSPE
jgi:hypothetical protein